MANNKRLPIAGAIPGWDIAWDNGTHAYSTAQVREFLKSEAGRLDREKIGYGRIAPEKDANGYYVAQFFASPDAAVEFDSLDAENPARGELLVASFAIPILEMEEGTTYPIGLTARSRAAIVSIDGRVEVEVMFTAHRKDPGAAAVENTVTGTLVVQSRPDTAHAWQQRKVLPIVSDNEQWQRIDISDCVEADIKDYQVRMYVTVDDEIVQGTTQAVTWQSITKTSLALTYASDWSKALRGTVYAPAYYAAGCVDKTLHVRITNQTGQVYDGTARIGVDEYTTQAFRGFAFADTSGFKMLSRHGVCKIESWLSVTGEDEKQSPHIYNQVMVVADESDTTPRLMLQDLSTDTPLQAQNYVRGELFRYAVYNPSGAPLPLEFRLTDYGGRNVYMSFPADNPPSETQLSLDNAIEIEDVAGSTIVAVLRAWSAGAEMSEGYPCSIDNSLNFSPTVGADFVMNPKLRSNAESDPARIVNARNGAVMEGAVMEGFTFADGIDGWTADESGLRCLRVPAGRRVSIPYDIWAAHRQHGSRVSMTFEIDFATRNVIDEDTPIVRACDNGLSRGIIMRALEGVVYSAGNTAHDEQSYMWREGVKTHVAVNILHDYQPDARISARLAVCRVFVNGVIQREFSFDPGNATEWFVAGQGQTIEIGQDNADIDIYSLRVYANSASTVLMSEDILQNYISTLPTAAEKLAVRGRNAITQGGKITLDKVLGAGLNAWVFRGRVNSKEGAASGGTTDDENNHGDLKVWIHDEQGVLIPECSGVINDTDHKNQGTTANSYAEHNQQDKFGDTSVFTDLNGVTHSGYRIDPSVPEATKLVVKINWASSMQSHKMGATALYNDLYRQMCADNKQMLVDNPQARVAVLEKPVFMFEENPGTGEMKFLGLGTFGPGKMDKPTWGYDDSLYPEFCMVEGSDNNRTLTDMRCPWDDSVTYDPDKEAYYKGGMKSIGFSAGKTTKVGGKKYPTDAVMRPVKDAFNFLYTCNPFIRHYDGTLQQLQADPAANTTYQYWLTQGDKQWHVYRWNEASETAGEWVPAGVGGEAVTVAEYASLGDYNRITKAVIAARVAAFRAAVDSGQHVYKNDLLFSRAFLKLFAGTDNQSKNTYYCAVKSTEGNTLLALHADDLDTIMLTDNVGALTKPYHIEERDRVEGGDGYYWEGQYNTLYMLADLAYSAPSKVFTIGDVEIPGADESDSLRTTMATMLTLMGNLVSKPGLSRDAAGCIEQYFFSTQEYFCETAYNETARVRYESNQALLDAGNNGLAGSRGTMPLQQSTGNQLDAERQYIARRLAYISSWANYGVFGGAQTTSGAWIFPVTSNANGADQPVTIRLTLTPHQWLYASGKSGSTVVRSDVRMRPGQPYEFTLLQGASIASDTEHAINGIDYYRSVGNLGDMPIGTAAASLNVSGKRLVEFVANPTDTANPQFRPQSVSFSGSFAMMRNINLQGCSRTGGALNLSGLGRLETLNVRGTQVNGAQLPRTSTLTTVHLSAYTSSVEVDGQTNLATLTMQGYCNLTSYRLMGRHRIDSYTQLCAIYDARPEHLSTVRVDSVAWPSCTRTLLMWLASRSSTLNGVITMDGEDGAISFADKVALGRAFGNIDSDVSGLRVDYNVSPIGDGDVCILCRGFMNEAGHRYTLEAAATTGAVNNFALREDGSADVVFTLDPAASVYADLDGDHIYVHDLQPRDSAARYTLTMRLRLINGREVEATRRLAFCIRTPQLGDFAYADGTFDSEYSPASPLAGIVYKVDPDESAVGEAYTIRVVSPVERAGQKWGMRDSGWSATRAEIDAALNASVWNIASIPDVTSTSPSDPRRLMDDGVAITGAAADFNGKRYTEAMVQMSRELINLYARQVDSTIMFPNCLTAENPGDVTVNETLAKLTAAFGPNSPEMLFLPALMSTLHQPQGDDVHEQYARGQWYLPAAGELALIMYYVALGINNTDYTNDNGLKTPIFARASQRAGVVQLVPFSNSYFWSSSETNSAIAWQVSRSSISYSNYNKQSAYPFHSVAAFHFEL